MTNKITPSAQLEIAAHWLREAAQQFQVLKQFDYTQNLRRVASQCDAAAEAAGRK